MEKALREIKSIQRDLRHLSNLINADVRTADRLISVPEACKYLGKKKTAVYAMISRGDLPAKRDANGRIRLSFNQIQHYIQK